MGKGLGRKRPLCGGADGIAEVQGRLAILVMRANASMWIGYGEWRIPRPLWGVRAIIWPHQYEDVRRTGIIGCTGCAAPTSGITEVY